MPYVSSFPSSFNATRESSCPSATTWIHLRSVISAGSEFPWFSLYSRIVPSTCSPNTRSSSKIYAEVRASRSVQVLSVSFSSGSALSRNIAVPSCLTPSAGVFALNCFTSVQFSTPVKCPKLSSSSCARTRPPFSRIPTRASPCSAPQLIHSTSSHPVICGRSFQKPAK